MLSTVDRYARRLAPCDLLVPALTDRPSGRVTLAGVPPAFADGYARHAAEDRARTAHLRPRHAGAVRLSEVVPARALRRSAIYNEVMQFFLIVLGFAPLVFLGLRDAGGWSGLVSRLLMRAIIRLRS